MADFKRSSLLILAVAVAACLVAAVGCSNDDQSLEPAIDTIPPAIPEGVGGWIAGGSAVQLTWQANTVDSDLAGYVVYRSTDNATAFRPINATPVLTNSWTDNDVQAGHTYHYRVAARDVSSNESGWSQTFSVQIAAPAGSDTPRSGVF